MKSPLNSAAKAYLVLPQMRSDALDSLHSHSAIAWSLDSPSQLSPLSPLTQRHPASQTSQIQNVTSLTVVQFVSAYDLIRPILLWHSWTTLSRPRPRSQSLCQLRGNLALRPENQRLKASHGLICSVLEGSLQLHLTGWRSHWNWVGEHMQVFRVAVYCQFDC